MAHVAIAEHRRPGFASSITRHHERFARQLGGLRWLHKNKQAMENGNYFGNYTLSQATLDKLKKVEELLNCEGSPADPAWLIIKPKPEPRIVDEPEDEPPVDDEVAEAMEDDDYSALPSTQFYFSQKERTHKTPKTTEPLDSSWCDVAESLYESLEKTNGTCLSLVELTKLSDSEVDCIVKYLSTKLSLRGIYNLCHSLCASNMDQTMIYIKMICTNLLLQKIIDAQEPSRLMSSLIHELVEKFPEDIQEFIFVPILNVELRDTSVISTMINGFPPQRKIDLITNFLASVQELKEWHINVLIQIVTIKLVDNSIKEKLLKLLLENASTFSRDKNYGKFILSFLKLHSPFNEDQKNSLSEIVAINETTFKRVMENLLRNMYFHGDLWHIS